MNHAYLALLSVSLLALSALAQAGTITLQNGNVLEGSVKKVEKSQVQWSIGMAGTVTIKKENIVFLESRQKFKLKGKSRPCYWGNFDGAVVEFNCEDGDSLQVPFLSIDNLVPFSGYKQLINFDRGQLSFLGSQEAGNFERRNIEGRARYELRRADWRHEIVASYQRETFANDNQLRRGAAEYGLDWFFRPQWFLYFNNRYEQDDSLNLDHRQLHGLGYGYQFFETSATALSVENGIRYVDELFEQRDGTEIRSKQFLAFVLSAQYRLSLPLGFRMNTDGDISWAMDDSDNGQARGALSLYLPVIKNISTEVRYEFRFENDPVDNNQKVDRTLKLGINYSWN